ncbi:hypothetical protein [Streptomyces sp. NPDC001508]|uniref:hypothetical protein n=1 Tax=Streptomyces sp. NPDC001508 TaxID=3154656 RepID=UPI0033339106
MVQLAGCEDNGCPGIWIDGDQLLAQGATVTDQDILARTNPSDSESLVALPKRMLGEAMASALTRLIA